MILADSVICLCLGHCIRVQPTWHEGEARKQAAEGAGESGLLLVLPLLLRFSGGWKETGSSGVFLELKVARAALLLVDSLLSRRDELIPRCFRSAGHLQLPSLIKRLES